MPDEPQTDSVTFWERITKLGVHGFLTIGLDASYVVMIFVGVAVPSFFTWLLAGMNGWLIGSNYAKARKP